ncbi:hypothetical protein, partial [Luteibacter sp. CQ10]|uniref:hypothetical protein n=1 Tax=Luteibacter sp. CQ10 TaxID=2805821 RepID=UPI0034A22A60
GGTNAHVLVEAAPAADATARVPLEPPRFRRMAMPSLGEARRMAPIDPAPPPTPPSPALAAGFWERYG